MSMNTGALQPTSPLKAGWKLLAVEPSDEFVKRVQNNGIWAENEVRNLYADIMAAAPEGADGPPESGEAAAQSSPAPLTIEQVEAAFNSDSHENFADFLSGVRFAERTHGIGKGWKLLPVEPSDEFVKRVQNSGVWGENEVRNLYADIMAAAGKASE